MNWLIDGLNNVLSLIPVVAVAGIGAGLLRSVAGWLENVLKDGHIDRYEWQQLLGTIVKYIVGILLFTIGGLPIAGSVTATFVADIVTGAIKKTGSES